MKVVVISAFAPSLINFRGLLLEAMVNSGHEVIACAPSSPQDVIRALAKMGVSYREISLQRTGTNPGQDVKTFFELKNLFHQLAPDIVLCYNIKPVIYGSLAARYARVPNLFSMVTGVGYAFGESSFKQRLIGAIVQPL